MDRIEFLNSIKYTEANDKVIDILMGFFDQYMVLYNLIDNVSGISVIGYNDNCINFLIEYFDKDSAAIALNKLSTSNTFYLYNRVFYIQAQSNNKKSNIITIS